MSLPDRDLSVFRSALIVGCGDIGCRVAARMSAAGVVVTGVVQSPGSAQRVAASGATPLMLDLDGPQAADALAHEPQPLVFWLAPPPPAGPGDPRLRAWLAAGPGARRVVYVSTSGVYGDCGGRWIDESEPLKPQTDRARRRVDAETVLLEQARAGFEPLILRVPGIYGPGRLPVERLRQGLPVIAEAEAPWSNRIHSEDLAEIALAAALRGVAGQAYNASDGHPSTMTDYFTRCARLLGLPDPPRVSLAEARQTFSPAMLSFIEESKRLANTRLGTDLGVELAHPTLASGLSACLEPAV